MQLIIFFSNPSYTFPTGASAASENKQANAKSPIAAQSIITDANMAEMASEKHSVPLVTENASEMTTFCIA